jgi:hypothetical protein
MSTIFHNDGTLNGWVKYPIKLKHHIRRNECYPRIRELEGKKFIPPILIMKILKIILFNFEDKKLVISKNLLIFYFYPFPPSFITSIVIYSGELATPRTACHRQPARSDCNGGGRSSCCSPVDSYAEIDRLAVLLGIDSSHLI